MSQKRSQRQLGNQQFHRKNFQKAIHHYKNHLDLEQKDQLPTLLNIAFCYFKLQSYSQAIQTCNEIISQDETFYKCYYRRAMCRKQLISELETNRIQKGLNSQRQALCQLMQQKYCLWYDCQMFAKYGVGKGVDKEIKQFADLSKKIKEKLRFCGPVKGNWFFRDLLELEKGEIKQYAQSQMQVYYQQYAATTQPQKIQCQIDQLYRQIALIKRNQNQKQKDKDKQKIQKISTKIRQLVKVKKTVIELAKIQAQVKAKAINLLEKTEPTQKTEETENTQTEKTQKAVEVQKMEKIVKAEEKEKIDRNSKETVQVTKENSNLDQSQSTTVENYNDQSLGEGFEKCNGHIENILPAKSNEKIKLQVTQLKEQQIKKQIQKAQSPTQTEKKQSSSNDMVKVEQNQIKKQQNITQVQKQNESLASKTETKAQNNTSLSAQTLPKPLTNTVASSASTHDAVIATFPTGLQLFTKFFKPQLENSRERAKLFAQLLSHILALNSLSKQIKAQLITVISQKLVDCKILMLSLEKGAKDRLREELVGLEVGEPIMKKFGFK